MQLFLDFEKTNLAEIYILYRMWNAWESNGGGFKKPLNCMKVASSTPKKTESSQTLTLKKSKQQKQLS